MDSTVVAQHRAFTSADFTAVLEAEDTALGRTHTATCAARLVPELEYTSTLHAGPEFDRQTFASNHDTSALASFPLSDGGARSAMGEQLFRRRYSISSGNLACIAAPPGLSMSESWIRAYVGSGAKTR